MLHYEVEISWKPLTSWLLIAQCWNSSCKKDKTLVQKISLDYFWREGQEWVEIWRSLIQIIQSAPKINGLLSCFMPATLASQFVNSQLVCFCQFGFLTRLRQNLQYLLPVLQCLLRVQLTQAWVHLKVKSLLVTNLQLQWAVKIVETFLILNPLFYFICT